jgi:1,4-dihydroxy-2-naphthoyl-CoA hydrolase
MLGHLGIRFIEIGDDYLVATMPVDHRTQQPFGLLHGGASVALAESMGSVGSQLCLDADQFFCVGLEINANHIRAVRSGQVKGVARPLHIGRRTQVWDIRIYDEQERLVCVSRLTLAVLSHQE